MVQCFVCGGDGKETCNNPDHGFIAGTPGDIGRIGCPGCGHDPYHKVKGGGKCEGCFGSGKLNENEAEKLAKEYGFEDEFEYL